jgi:hypothetical protein
MSTPPLKAVAYHEAGHAVMAFELQRAVRQISIVPSADAEGFVRPGKRPPSFHPDYNTDNKTRDWVEREVLISLAGCAADSKYRGRTIRAGGADDYNKAISMAAYLTPELRETIAYVEWLRIKAENMIAFPPNWSAVQAIAAELLDRKTISGRRARQIYAAAQEQSFREVANWPDPFRQAG